MMAAFLAPGLLILVLMFITLGYWLACARLTEQRQALDAEWRALDNTRRVRTVFLHARLAMRDEALRAAQTQAARLGHEHHRKGGAQQ